MMAFCPEHPEWDQNPKFIPLSETTSIPTPFIWGVLSSPRAKGLWYLVGKVLSNGNAFGIMFFILFSQAHSPHIRQSNISIKANLDLTKERRQEISVQCQRYLILDIRTPPWLNRLSMKSSVCLLGWSAAFHLFSMRTLVGVCLTSRKAGKRLHFLALWVLSFVAGLWQIRLYRWLLVVLDIRRNANRKKADQNLKNRELC